MTDGLGFRRRSVRATVVAAAFAVAAMTLVAVGISAYSYTRIEHLFAVVSQEQATALNQALRLAETTNRYAAGSGEIEAARNQIQRQNAVVSLGQHAYALVDALSALRRIPATAPHVEPIAGIVRALEENVSQRNQLVEQRIEVEGKNRRLRQSLERLQAGLDVFLARLDNAEHRAVSDSLRWDLESAGDRMMLRLYDAGQIEQHTALQAAQANFDAARIRFDAAVAALPAGSPEQAAAGRLLAEFTALATGPDGLFPVRTRLLALRADSERRTLQGREVVTTLSVAVSRVVGLVEQQAEQTKAAVAAQISAARHWLVAVAAATFLGPLAFVWLVVGRTVVRPLAQLAAATRRIADGDLNTPIPPVRHSEFLKIAGALEVFRTNTAALAQRTHALTASEEAQRQAREQAERALADLRAAQEQLIHSEKMAALGSVVAGVAHEVNTPIGITLTGASLLTEEVKTIMEAQARGALKRSEFESFIARSQEIAGLIQGNMERAANLVQAFKQVAADQSSERRRGFDLRETLSQTIISVKPKCDRAGVAIALDCAEGLIADSYPGALSQVVTILVMNSLDHAFSGDGGGGHIAITVAEKDGGQVRIDYRDTGPGIPADVRRRVFEPFFTTRRGQGNTGLGLHLAFNTVQQNLKGHLSLGPEGGEGGAHFILTLPLALPLETAAPEKSTAG
ncbi:signal transduction histidine kinase [Azospirillum fermentarium]|uniref:sensor histidine kinase n=1 Tax=Azospirillum fermentarium TaxID=1233114 RepID=UPI002227FB45|nr:ATP-binding protein [Azospirillum fermentarium]MCW2248075.1 signal transduction histidine kinase [Azospirillum fermentarium]